MSINEETRYSTMTPEEYAALWDFDPVCDTPPREHGDGYLFYNYNVVGDWKMSERIKLYEGLIPAIERTILSVQQDPESHEPFDAEAGQPVS